MTDAYATEDNQRLILLADEAGTTEFAACWPASALRGHPVKLVLDKRNGDLIDGEFPEDVLSEELSAFIDFVLTKRGHSRAFIAVFAK